MLDHVNSVSLKPSNGNRKNIRDVLLLITTGKPVEEIRDPITTAKLMRDNGVQVSDIRSLNITVFQPKHKWNVVKSSHWKQRNPNAIIPANLANDRKSFNIEFFLSWRVAKLRQIYWHNNWFKARGYNNYERFRKRLNASNCSRECICFRHPNYYSTHSMRLIQYRIVKYMSIRGD